MGIMNRLFGRPVPDKMKYLEALVEMAREGERTYRGFINTYIKDVQLNLLSAPPGSAPVVLTGRGVYKARLFGAAFMAFAYSQSRACPSVDASMEMYNVASGAALEPLQSGDVRLSKDEAKSFTLGYLNPLVKSLVAAFKAGPMMPGNLRPEHVALTDYLHDAMTESIGRERYTAQVRERFDVLVQGNTAAAMNHARQWII